jgi:hypothetical protein
MYFMQFTVTTPRPWLRSLPGVVIIVIIILVTAHAAPGAVVPLGLGGWLSCHLLGIGSSAEPGPRR